METIFASLIGGAVTLVGVLIALTALIPIVGAFIGCAVGALLIAIDDPWKALWFIVLFLVLQQIEGNLSIPMWWAPPLGCPPSGCWRLSRWAAA